MEDDSHKDLNNKSNNKTSKNNSMFEELKMEWSLFWAGLVGEEESEEGPRKFLESFQDLNLLKKRLSGQRSDIFQKMESLKKEIDLNQAKLASLKLVGGETEDIVERIDVLSEQGQFLIEQLEKIDQKVRELRQHEESIP